jgi:hypothetical protein
VIVVHLRAVALACFKSYLCASFRKQVPLAVLPVSGSHFATLLLRGRVKYGVGVACSSLTFLRNSMEIGHLVQRLLVGGHTDIMAISFAWFRRDG